VEVRRSKKKVGLFHKLTTLHSKASGKISLCISWHNLTQNCIQTINNTINGIQLSSCRRIWHEPIRITGLLFFGLQSLSGLALERKSEKNPEDDEKGGGCSDSVHANRALPALAQQSFFLCRKLYHKGKPKFS
jgi:hypothetical protein